MSSPVIASIEIVPATRADSHTICSIMEEAAGWLASRHINQWQGGVPVEQIRHRIEHGETYLAWHNGEVIGTITLQWSDPFFWDDAPDDAGYVHGLAIRRAVAGQGVGRQLLRWAEAQIAKSGKQYIRLDCVANNPALCEYYQRAGFAPHGIKQFTNSAAQLFEKRAELTDD